MLGNAKGRGPRPRLNLLAHFGARPIAGVAPPPGDVVHSAGTESDGAGFLRLLRGAVHLTLEEAA